MNNSENIVFDKLNILGAALKENNVRSGPLSSDEKQIPAATLGQSFGEKKITKTVMSEQVLTQNYHEMNFENLSSKNNIKVTRPLPS